MTQDEWQGPIPRRDLQPDPLDDTIRHRVYALNDRFLSGGLCSIKF
ncbi:MAG: hypothetical protein ACFFC7_09145 [Candidatus Hermodarchaeota archaeon]